MPTITQASLVKSVLVALSMLAVHASNATADEIEEFYRGKQIRLIVGQEAGSSYDAIARSLIHVMGNHIPGNPSVVTQNMVGAGTRVAANYLYNLAPRDGTVVGMISQSTPLDQALKQEGIKFDAAKFNWIGTPVVDNQIFGSTAASGLSSIDDVRAKGGLICAATNASNASVIYPQMINNLAGTSIRIITGYTSTATINLAMERGEANCFGSNTWSNLKAQLGHLMKDKKINILVQWGPDKNPDISAYQGSDVPLSSEFAKSDLDRKVFALVNSAVTMGRPLFAPPDVPEARIAALRKAFAETIKDPEFIAEAAKQQIEINPKFGDYLQAVVAEVTSASPEVLERLKTLSEAP